jgi:hypothetical protein
MSENDTMLGFLIKIVCKKSYLIVNVISQAISWTCVVHLLLCNLDDCVFVSKGILNLSKKKKETKEANKMCLKGMDINKPNLFV